MSTDDDAKINLLLALPVTDGLDAVAEALELHRKSTGEAREHTRRILSSLLMTFTKLAPLTTCADRWNRLKIQVLREIS
jgi:hypothetical protein